MIPGNRSPRKTYFIAPTDQASARRNLAERGDADDADDLPAECALIALAFTLDAARLAAAAKAAGSGGWPSSLATRTVTSYLLGGGCMQGCSIATFRTDGSTVTSIPRLSFLPVPSTAA